MGSSKNFLKPFVIVPSTKNLPEIIPPITGSLAAAFFSPATVVNLGDSVTYQINIATVDSTGTFFAQCSDDGINFSDIGICGVVNAENDWAFSQIDPADGFYYRVRYAPTISGTGSCVILVGNKPKGG